MANTFEKIPELELIVFDLDYTLWPFWVDTHVTPPFSKDSQGKVMDVCGQRIRYYPEVPDVLRGLTKAGYKLGVASRTHTPTEARELLKLFGWYKDFTIMEIYPGCKIAHFNKMKSKLDLPFERMLFFDDEYRNIKDLQSIGVKSILVKNGVNTQLVKEAIANFTTGGASSK